MDNHLMRDYCVLTGSLPSRSLQTRLKVGTGGGGVDSGETQPQKPSETQIPSVQFPENSHHNWRETELKVWGRRNTLERPSRILMLWSKCTIAMRGKEEVWPWVLKNYSFCSSSPTLTQRKPLQSLQSQLLQGSKNAPVLSRNLSPCLDSLCEARAKLS